MHVISLKCVNCGATLELAPGVDTFGCAYCGTTQHVERSGGTVSLKRIESALSNVQQSTDRTASELALVRLKAELAAVLAQKEADVQVIRNSTEKGKQLFGIAFLFGAFISMMAFGWIAIAVVAFLVLIGWLFVSPIRPNTSAVEREAQRRMATIRDQIRKHQSIVNASSVKH